LKIVNFHSPLVFVTAVDCVSVVILVQCNVFIGDERISTIC